MSVAIAQDETDVVTTAAAETTEPVNLTQLELLSKVQIFILQNYFYFRAETFSSFLLHFLDLI